MKRITSLLFLGLVLFLFTGTANSQNVTVNPGAGSYATLKDAFDAINAGTHTGAITVSIDANTTESAPAVLNSSGAGSASYTSVNIFPTSDNVGIYGTTTTGRGLIELKGADNVTIDGDNPNTGGTNRNLTITNTALETDTYTSVVRICMTATFVASADNNTIKNCILNGSATGRNFNSANSTIGSENTTFGVLVGGNGGVSATDSPTAVTAVTGTAPSGTTVNALLVQNNTVNQCARGIAFLGAVAGVSTGVTITGNLVGDQGSVTGSIPFTTPSTTVYTKGIIVQGTTAITISNNTVKNILSYVAAAMAGIELTTAIGTGGVMISGNTVTTVANNVAGNIPTGILVSNAGGVAYTVRDNTVSNVQIIGANSCSGITGSVLNGTFQRNRIFDIINNNTTTYGAYGINITAGNTQTIQNNLIYNIMNNQVAGSGGYSNTFGTIGIRIAAGTGHRIYYNTVNLYGAMPGVLSTNLTTCIGVTANTSTGMDIRNNILSNQITGGNTSAAGTRHVSIALATGGSVTMNLTVNNNVMWGSADVNSRLASNAFTAGSGEFTAANFDPTVTTPATNWRAYTSTLSAGGLNDNASTKNDPILPSNTNLQIVSFSSSAYSAGTPIGTILTDYLQVTRSVSTPTIGAYELSPPATPTDAGVNNVIRNPAGVVLVGQAVDFYARVKNYGTLSQSGIPVYYRVVGGATVGPIATTGTMVQNDTQTVHFELGNVFNPGVAGTYTLKFYTQLSGDVTFTNDTTTISITVQDAFTDAGVSAAFSTKVTAGLPIVGAQYNFRAVARNFGTLPLGAPVDVYYKDNGGAAVGPLSATITNPGDTQSVFFSTYTLPSAGVHTLKFYTNAPSDNSAANDTQTVTIDATQITSYPYIDRGNVGSPFTVLTEIVAGTTALWGIAIATQGPTGVGDTSYRANFYNGSAPRREVLRTPVLDFSSMTRPIMDFSRAYRTYTGGEDDSLEIVYSTDGGLTFVSQTDVYHKARSSSPSLATLPPSATALVPALASDWKHESVSFAELGGMSGIVIGFRAKSNFGNMLWIDNIEIKDATGMFGTSTVAATGAYSPVPTITVNFTALARPNFVNEPTANKIRKSDVISDNTFAPLSTVYNTNSKVTTGSTITDDPLGGVLKASQFDNIAPPTSAAVNIATIGSQTRPDGSTAQPTEIATYRYYTVTYSGDDFTGTATYDFSIDMTSYIGLITNPDQLYIMKRVDQTASWVALSTTRAGNVLTATGITGFSDFAIGGNQILPVELSSFTANINKNNVDLNWSTVTETNNIGFAIERKEISATAWTNVGFVTGAGNSTVTKNYSFSDRNLATAKYNYRLKQIDVNGNFKYYQLSSFVEVGVPGKFALSQNYPNPFNPSTKINYDLPFDSRVAIKIFDITGKEVASVLNQTLTAGYYTANFNASNLASGVYFYQINAEGGNQSFVKTLKMILIK